MFQVGVLFYIRSCLTVQQRNKLEEELKELDGVCIAYFASSRQHFLTVEYNPDKLNSRQVLQYVKSYDIDANNCNH